MGLRRSLLLACLAAVPAGLLSLEWIPSAPPELVSAAARERSLALDLTDRDAVLERGLALYEEEAFDESRELLETVLALDPDAAEAHYHLGRLALERQRDPEKAEAYFARALELNEDDARFHLGQASAVGMGAMQGGMVSNLLRFRSTARDVRTHLERAVELDPSLIEARQGLMMFHLMAPGLLGGDEGIAREQVDAIAALDAAAGHLARGAVLEFDEDAEGARREYEAAVAADPEEPSYAIGLGYYHLRREELDQAIAAFEAATRRFPEVANAWDSLGDAHLAREESERAFECFTRAHELDPTFSSPALHLARLHAEAGREAEARRHFELYLELASAGSGREEAIEWLAEHGGD